MSRLIRQAKRLFPIPHRWVTDTFTGTRVCVLNLCDNVDDALLRGLKLPLFTPAITYKLNNQFPSISSNWQTQQRVHPCIHAELRIILHLGPPSAIERLVQPIGVSKRCCFCCTTLLPIGFSEEGATSRLEKPMKGMRKVLALAEKSS